MDAKEINFFPCKCNIKDKIKYEGYINVLGNFYKKYKCLVCGNIWYLKPSKKEIKEFNGE